MMPGITLYIHCDAKETMVTDLSDATLPPVRLPKSLLDLAKAEARRRDETLSQVIRRGLRAYVGSAPKQHDLEDAIAATRPPARGRAKR